MVAKVAVPIITEPKKKPAKSTRRRCGFTLSGSAIAATTRASPPKSRLNQNTARHDQMPTRIPPTTGPIASARPEMAAHVPRARALVLRSGKR
jgi:hypothetical protein